MTIIGIQKNEIIILPYVLLLAKAVVGNVFNKVGK